MALTYEDIKEHLKVLELEGVRHYDNFLISDFYLENPDNFSFITHVEWTDYSADFYEVRVSLNGSADPFYTIYLSPNYFIGSDSQIKNIRFTYYVRKSDNHVFISASDTTSKLKFSNLENITEYGNTQYFLFGGGYNSINISKIPEDSFIYGTNGITNEFPTIPWTLVIPPINYQGFLPDPGTDPDAGGGNQDWGQGNPGTDTTGGTFDNISDTIVEGTSTSFKAGQSFNNYFVLDLPQVFEVKEEIWALTVPGFTRPSEGIISLLYFPFGLESRSFDSLDPDITIGNSFITLDTNVWVLDANYDNVVNFGNITIEPYFGGFQDYSPYTKIQIYLPFIGYRDLDPTYIQGKQIGVKYYVNMSNGSCIAVITSDGLIYTKFNGQIGQTIPLTQVNHTILEATTGTALQAAAMAVVNPVAGIATLASGSLSNIVNNRPSISGSAGGGGECELSLALEVYLRIERPLCAIPQTYNAEKGRPSMINKQLSNCKGFTQMADPKVTAPCTSSENDQINNLLRSGVIING